MSQIDNEDLNFNDVKHRLDEIKEQVGAEDISLDDSLDLYEEAVNLGMKATTTVEQNIGSFLNESNSDDKTTNDDKPENGNSAE